MARRGGGPVSGPRPRDLHIKARRIGFDYLRPMRQNRFWHRDGPLYTHFLNALQGTFPEGERFFIEAARDGVRQLKRRGALEPRLEEDFEVFLRQEGFHSIQHAHWTDALVQVGYRRMRRYDEIMLAHRRWFRRHLSARTRLGMTAAAEHYTASLAYLMVYGTTSLLNGMGRPYQDLLLYHAMEEVEHKAVCYDLYQALSGSYPRRALTFLFISFYVWLNIYLRNRYLLSADGLWGGRRSRDARSFYWGNRGVLRLLLPRMRQYLRRSFHPWQSDERLDFERTFGELRESLGIAPFG